MPDQRPLRMLIVDPNASAAQVSGAIAARAAPDALLTIEREAEQACRNLVRIQPDVLLIDPSLSLLAGIKVITAAKEQYPAMQVIVVASAPTAGLRRQMHELGVDLYLEKPSPLLVADLRAFLLGARQPR